MGEKQRKWGNLRGLEREKPWISKKSKAFGGDKRDRTADLLNAIVSVRWTGCKLRTIRYICAE